MKQAICALLLVVATAGCAVTNPIMTPTGEMNAAGDPVLRDVAVPGVRVAAKGLYNAQRSLRLATNLVREGVLAGGVSVEQRDEYLRLAAYARDAIHAADQILLMWEAGKGGNQAAFNAAMAEVTLALADALGMQVVLAKPTLGSLEVTP